MADTELYRQAAELCAVDQDVRIVGSLGRSALTGELLAPIRTDGTPRNINVLHCTPGNEAIANSRLELPEGTPVSTRFNRWIQFEDGGARLVFAPRPSIGGIGLPNWQDTFAPVDLSVGEYTIRTVQPQVHNRLLRLMGTRRLKDVRSIAAFDPFATSQPNPDAEAFDRFERLVMKQRGYHIKQQFREVYQTFIPERQRARLSLSTRLAVLAVDRFDTPDNYWQFCYGSTHKAV